MPARSELRKSVRYGIIRIVRAGIEYLPANRQGSFLNFWSGFPAWRSQAGIPILTNMPALHQLKLQLIAARGDNQIGQTHFYLNFAPPKLSQ